MENFTNETIDTTSLPRFEEVAFSPRHPNYWKVTLINLVIFFVILFAALGIFLFYNAEIRPYKYHLLGVAAFLVVAILFFSRISFRKKAFAFRNHDVLFKYGLISDTTIVIPYNRVQHVALHEGLVARSFGVATVEIFTAGGKSSDISIPGIEKEQAENIRQLLMNKIQKQL